MRRVRVFGAMVVMVTLVAAAGACTTPPGGAGGLIGLGEHSGQIWLSQITYQYDGVAGESLNVALGVDDALENFGGTLRVLAPDGSAVAPLDLDRCQSTSRACIITVVLPSTGRYTIVFPTDLTPTAANNFILNLSHDEDRGVLPFGVSLASPSFGQTLFYTYDGTAGDTINVYAATVFDPDGVLLVTTPVGTFHDQLTLPVSGTYTVRVRAVGAVLSRDLVGGPIGLGNTVTPSLFGNMISYTYAGTSGEVLDISSGTLLDPDGAVVAPLPGGLGRLLVVDGTYTLDVGVSPLFGPEAISLWLTHDLDGGTITPGDTVATGLHPGQALTYAYPGAAGEILRVRTDYSAPGVPPDIRVVASDGTAIARTYFYDGGGDRWASFTLPSSDTYRIRICPTFAPASLTVSIWSIP